MSSQKTESESGSSGAPEKAGNILITLIIVAAVANLPLAPAGDGQRGIAVDWCLF